MDEKELKEAEQMKNLMRDLNREYQAFQQGFNLREIPVSLNQKGIDEARQGMQIVQENFKEEKKQETPTLVHGQLHIASSSILKGRSYKLKKMALGIGLAVGAVTLIATFSNIKKQVTVDSLNKQMIELQMSAEEIAEMSQQEITVGKDTMVIGEEVQDYIAAKGELLEAKQSGSQEDIQKANEKVQEEGKDIQNIAEQMVKEKAAPFLQEALDNASNEAVVRIYQSDSNNSGESLCRAQVNESMQQVGTPSPHYKDLEGDFTNATAQGDIDKQIEEMAQFSGYQEKDSHTLEEVHKSKGLSQN